MDRTILVTGLLLVGAGAGVFLWKAVDLELPVLPDREPGIWQVELSIAARGDGRQGSVLAALPSNDAGQRIFAEHFASDRLSLDVRDANEGRTAVWRGFMEDVHRVYYGFSVQLFPVEVPLGAPYAEPGERIRSAYTRPSVGIPSRAPEIRSLLAELELPGPEDVGGRIRALFAFARHELSGADSSSDDALLTLAERAGSARGRERLLVTLLRGAGIPARIVQGLELRETRPGTRLWTEVWVNGGWVPISASSGFFGSLPRDTLELANDDQPLVRAAGTRAIGYEFSSLRERLSADDLAALMLPPSPILRAISLYRLPLPTQNGMRVLLLFSAATLVVSLLRTGIGIPSYGTFMPALLALSMRVTGLVDGLILIVLVIGIGIAGRLVLERLRLLFVPRLSILVCIVVLSVAALGLAGRSLDRAGLFGGILLPVVILTMLIERFSIVMVEEGVREALGRAFWSVVIAVTVYPVLRSQTLEQVFFAFPELILVVIGLQVWIGGYTGYRLSELLRFRNLRRPAEAR